MLEKQTRENQSMVSEFLKHQLTTLPSSLISKSEQSHTPICEWRAIDFLKGQFPTAREQLRKEAEGKAPRKCPHSDPHSRAPAASSQELWRSQDWAMQARVACDLKHFPPSSRQTASALVPDILPEKHYKQNTNYPCCCTWRIEAHFAAGAAHFPASVSNSSRPLPPNTTLSQSAQVASHATHQSGLSTFKALPGGVSLVLG